MAQLVERFDFTRIDAARVSRTPQGFLRLGGRLTRVGGLDYYRADGSVYRELRLPKEVFDANSLNTLQLAPVTNLHGGMVSPDNVQALQVGITGADIVGGADGAFVTGSATIQRADTIKAVQRRDLTELSPGYQCWVEDGAGEWDGSAYGLGIVRYDGVQRDIVYNHLAVGPKDWGRSGPDVRLRMDGAAKLGAFARCDSSGLGAFLRDRFSLLNLSENDIAKALQIERFELGLLLDGFSMFESGMLDKVSGLIDEPVAVLEGMVPASQKGEAPIKRDGGHAVPDINPGAHIMKKQITLDGIAYEIDIDERLALTFESALGKLRTDAAEASKAKGELAAETKAHADTKTKLDSATNPEALQAAIGKRTQLVEDAKTIAPELTIDERADSKTVQIAALVAAGFEQSTFDNVDAGFVAGSFAAALRSAKAAAKTDAKPAPEERRTAGPAPRLDAKGTGTGEPEVGTVEHSDAARARMVERNRSMSAGKLDAATPGAFPATPAV